MGFAGWVALLAVAGAVTLVVRGWDVRLVLLGAAVLVAGAGGDVSPVAREFLGTFSNEKFVVPICSAMGFAYVLRATGCERHLVLLLVRPLRRVRGLMVPGVVGVGFLVNVPVVSQASTAVCLGSVVVPLMRAAGYTPATIGACLLLGSSVGGELLNPGAPELLTVFDKTGVSTREQVERTVPPVVFVQLVVSALVLWAMSGRWERRDTSEDPRSRDPESAEGSAGATKDQAAAEPVDWIKAAVPLVPLAFLFLAGPPFSVIDVPEQWLLVPKKGATGPDPTAGSRLVGLAMLVGVVAAALATPRAIRGVVRHFFDGAGYGFANIVSLIVVANCFAKAIEQAGLATVLGSVIRSAPGLLDPLAGFVPLVFAALSGSGMATTQGLYGFFYGPAVEHGVDPAAVGALVSVGSAAGRTMSPVAAVVLMCGTLTGANPLTLAKRVAGPLTAGMVVVVALRALRLI